MDIDVLVVLGIAIFMGFFIQTLVGFAGSLIALPILLFKMNLPNAIAYISLFYLLSSFFLLSKEWKNIDRRVIIRLAFASLIGVSLGILVLTYSKPIILKKALGIFILLYVAYSIFGKTAINLNKTGEICFGILGGFFSGVFSTGGPLYIISVKNGVKSMKNFRATMIGVMAVITLIRIPLLSFSGILTWSHVRHAIFIVPVFLLAQFLGKKAYSKLDEQYFKKILLGLLFLSGILLTVK